MKKIIFICTGNICRSPMANHYMQKKVKDLGKSDQYIIDSCGTYAVSGEMATKNAIEAMKVYGVNMENHRAKSIQELDLNEYDLIIGLTTTHKIAVQSLYPHISKKVYTLKEYANPEEKYIDIDDPWGLSMQVYDSCAKEIVNNVDSLIEKF